MVKTWSRLLLLIFLGLLIIHENNSQITVRDSNNDTKETKKLDYDETANPSQVTSSGQTKASKPTEDTGLTESKTEKTTVSDRNEPAESTASDQTSSAEDDEVGQTTSSPVVPSSPGSTNNVSTDSGGDDTADSDTGTDGNNGTGDGSTSLAAATTTSPEPDEITRPTEDSTTESDKFPDVSRSPDITNTTSANLSDVTPVTTDAEDSGEKDVTDSPGKDTGDTDTEEGDDNLVIPREELRVHIESQLVIESTTAFNDSLLEKTSAYFKKTRDFYEAQLTEAYKSIPYFQSVEVTSFSQGSLIANFIAVFSLAEDGDLLSNKIVSEMTQSVFEALNSSITDVNITALSASLTQIEDQLIGFIGNPCSIEDTCDRSYSCEIIHNRDVQCIHRCEAEKLECQNGGHCVLNTLFEPTCRCLRYGDVSYSGNKCEIKSEHLPISKKVLIAICAGGGGGIIFIFIITILILHHRQEQQKLSAYLTETKYRGGSSEASFKSIKDAERALSDSDIAGTNGSYLNQGFNNVEADALNTRRASNNYNIMSTSFSADLSNGYELMDRPHSAADGNNSVENNPDYPRSIRTYEEIDDKGTPAIMYKGSGDLQKPKPGVIYDYDSRISKTSFKSETILYDFDELNKPERYKIRRPTVNSETAY